MSLIPKYINQVNTIVRWWENPCDAPWTLYFELALPPAGNALLTLLAFGLDDVIRGTFRPKGIRSGRHLRRGRKSGRRGVGIPELGETIGKHLPGAQLARGRSVTQGVKNLWLVDGVIQRGLFYWMVADVGLTFAAEWLSAVQESQVCRTQRVGAAAWTTSTVFSPLPDWRGTSVQILYETGTVSVHGSGTLATSGFGVQTGNATIAVAIDGHGSNPETRLEVRVRSSDTILAQGSTTKPGPNAPDPERQSFISAPTHVKNPGGFVVEFRVLHSGFFHLRQALAVCAQLISDV